MKTKTAQEIYVATSPGGISLRRTTSRPPSHNIAHNDNVAANLRHNITKDAKVSAHISTTSLTKKTSLLTYKHYFAYDDKIVACLKA